MGEGEKRRGRKERREKGSEVTEKGKRKGRTAGRGERRKGMSGCGKGEKDREGQMKRNRWGRDGRGGAQRRTEHCLKRRQKTWEEGLCVTTASSLFFIQQAGNVSGGRKIKTK